MEDTRLVLKDTVNTRRSARHFVHSKSQQLGAFEIQMQNAKAEALNTGEVGKVILDEALPDGIFEQQRTILDPYLTALDDSTPMSTVAIETTIKDLGKKWHSVMENIARNMLSKLKDLKDSDEKAAENMPILFAFVRQVTDATVGEEPIDIYIQEDNKRREEVVQVILVSDKLTDWARALNLTQEATETRFKELVNQRLPQELETIKARLNEGSLAETDLKQELEAIVMRESEVEADLFRRGLCNHLNQDFEKNVALDYAIASSAKVVERTRNRSFSRLVKDAKTWLDESGV